MGEGKLFKTRLCALYQKGHCHRHNCSFAHGNADLRQSFASYNDKQDRRSGDLRDKLDMKFSPRRKYSPAKDTRGQRRFRGSSPSRSLERNSDRKRRRKPHFDGQSDFSGSLKSSDGAGDQVKRRKNTADSRVVLKEQLKEVRTEISMLEQQKSQLRILVQEKIEEADILSSRIRELDSQLSKEKEECKRTISKIKKFVKAHKHYVQIQEELKRSQGRLQKLGDQLGSGIITTGGNEEDSSINIVSDGEAPGSHAISPRNEVQNNSSPRENILHAKCDNAEESKKANSTNDGGYHTKTISLGKSFQLNANAALLNINKEVVMADNGNDRDRSIGNEGKQKRGKSVYACISSADKLKGSEIGRLAPSTSMAAFHAIDELVDVEVEESIEVVETASLQIHKGAAAYEVKKLPFLLPLPPPLPQITYSQYKGKDENVDVEALEEEMVDVDTV
ncbi:zinc finger CCCH domain-containing protein 13 isoform X2 [Ricinus communis]|uniref:C3H1-type domain-containing protein n=1 Tax=Ricinus communis TaxID=3988 RepID=B9RPR4_RICCO|nr:zinc finger CCCH domain-containing protein 13 isoform X2 [Ricinus communis]EEF46680.1 conserved hypothetical protein [Ricinus communis]|eukprot:XP_002515733.1 zinc finger CCCH domain-containing protein 13 isoform X2 [Ricinus communis]